MELYTLQLSNYREAGRRRIPFVNTTVKNGHKYFAPTWNMVNGVKSGNMSEEEYRKQYDALMWESMCKHVEAWDALIAYDKIAVACFCKSGWFCHRYLLPEYIRHYCERRGVRFEYRGEI